VLIRNFIFWLSTKRRVTNSIARRGMKYGFARRFVAGETLEEAITASQELCAQGRRVSLNHLGENVSTETAAREVCGGYIRMLEEMHAKNLRGNISIKLTQLGLDISKDFCRSLAREIAARASALSLTIEMDMEGSASAETRGSPFKPIYTAPRKIFFVSGRSNPRFAWSRAPTASRKISPCNRRKMLTPPTND
jgi:proline dehydrogenase